MPIMPPNFAKKKPAFGAAGAVAKAEEEETEGVDGEDGESPSDIDAPVMRGSKPNPLKMWAAAKSGAPPAQ